MAGNFHDGGVSGACCTLLVETVITKQQSKAIFFFGRQIFKMMAGNYSDENFGKVKISQDPTIRFEFPFVQSEIRS